MYISVSKSEIVVIFNVKTVARFYFVFKDEMCRKVQGMNRLWYTSLSHLFLKSIIQGMMPSPTSIQACNVQSEYSILLHI